MRMRHLWAVCSLVLAADPNIPHEHKGTLDPFKNGPPAPLSSAELAQLNAGKSVQKIDELAGGKGARAVTVFDIAAPPATVWACILDLKNYPKMVPGVAAMEIYKAPSASGGTTTTLAKWTLALLGYRLSYYLETRYEPRSNSMTFRLDYSRNSDIDDTVGYWHVAPLNKADGSTHSRVTYSAALTLKGWFPKPVVDILFATTIGRATSWVGVEATKRFAAAGGSASGKASCRRTWKGKVCVSTPPLPPPPPEREQPAFTVAVLTVLLCLYAVMKL